LTRAGGMQAVCDSEHFRECIAARPSNRERLLRTDPAHFIKVMTDWRERFLESASLPVVGASEEDLRSLAIPTCIIAGNDVIHTPATARKIAALIANSELHDDVVAKRSDDDLLQDWDRAEWRNQEKRIAEIFRAFLHRAEKRRTSPSEVA
jgi:hypothetical protein